MSYDIDFEEKALIKFHIRKFLLYPQHWNDTSNQYIHNLSWKKIKFEDSKISKLPNEKGIYCFIVRPKYPNFFETNYLFYIGQTARPLKKRFREYLNDQKGQGKPRPKIFEMLKLYDGYLYFYFATINQNTIINEVETKLLNTFVPHINTEIPKARIKPELRNIYE